MEKSTFLNIMKGNKRGLASEVRRLGTEAYKVMIKFYIKINNANVEENLTYRTIEHNSCSSNSSNHNHTYGIVDMKSTQRYIKVHTPCIKKVKIFR